MDEQTIKDILSRYQSGTCTEAERQLIESWILHGPTGSFDLTDAQLLEDLLEIRLRLERDLRRETSIRTLGFRKWVPYAAAALIVALIGTTVYYFGIQTHLQSEIVDIQSNDILPGGNKATLLLGDGRMVNLSAEQNGIVIGGEGIIYVDGTYVLGIGDDAPDGFDKQHAILTTPRGGQYQITLPDGTKVWLNSASKLRYPSRFDGPERVVELEGEAYFEVSEQVNKLTSRAARSHAHTLTGSQKVPFRVVSNGQTVEVLGTQFNVSAYGDDLEVKTTLVEGSVRVAPTTDHRLLATILKPGQQSTVSGTEITINDVAVSTFIGWKEGYFVFDGTELREAMKQLSRWYDVEIIYEGLIPRTPFYGRINRGDTLAEVLDILKEGKVNFRIEKQASGNRLVVMP